MTHPLTEYLRRPSAHEADKKLTQYEFAKLVGVSQPVISKFLRGETHALSREVAERVVRVTGGRVTLLDCIYSTPYALKQKSPRKKGGAQ